MKEEFTIQTFRRCEINFLPTPVTIERARIQSQGDILFNPKDSNKQFYYSSPEEWDKLWDKDLSREWSSMAFKHAAKMTFRMLEFTKARIGIISLAGMVPFTFTNSSKELRLEEALEHDVSVTFDLNQAVGHSFELIQSLEDAGTKESVEDMKSHVYNSLPRMVITPLNARSKKKKCYLFHRFEQGTITVEGQPKEKVLAFLKNLVDTQ